MATKRAMREKEETAPRVETVVKTATEEEDVEEEEEEEEEEGNSSSGGDFEVRVVSRGQGVEAAPSVSDDAQSVSDDTTEADADAERAANKCAFCSGRKVKGCMNLACKRCCLRTEKVCTFHSKTPEPKVKKAGEPVAVESVPQSLRKARKPVLKNEFKETNVLYYDETVTLFCLRDFFHAKKLSQPLLNDQTRRLRAAATSTEEKTPVEIKRIADSDKVKKNVMAALREGSDPKRRKVAATH